MDGRAKLLSKIAGFAPPPPSPGSGAIGDEPDDPTPPTESPADVPPDSASKKPGSSTNVVIPEVAKDREDIVKNMVFGIDLKRNNVDDDEVVDLTADPDPSASKAVEAKLPTEPSTDAPCPEDADGDEPGMVKEEKNGTPGEGASPDAGSETTREAKPSDTNPPVRTPFQQTRPSASGSGSQRLLAMLGGFKPPPTPPVEERSTPAPLDRTVSVASLNLDHAKKRVTTPPFRTSHEAPEGGRAFFRSVRTPLSASTSSVVKSGGRDRPVSMSLGMARATSLQNVLKTKDDQWAKTFLASLKKYLGSNKQLAVVSKYCAADISSPGKRGSKRNKKKDKKAAEASLKLIAQLDRAREAVTASNGDLTRMVASATRTPGNAGISPLLPILAMVASASSFLVNCMRSFVVECANTSVQKQVLTASRTVRDSLTKVLELVALAPLDVKNAAVEKQVSSAVNTVKRSISQLVMAQAAVTGGRLIPDWRRHEILGAAVAAVNASKKLTWIRDSFTPSKGELVVEGAKVVGTTISQMCASITDGANSDIMVAVPDYQQALLLLIEPLKAKLQLFIDETKKLLGFQDMGETEAYVTLRDEIIYALTWTDMMAKLSITKIDGTKTCPNPDAVKLEETAKLLNSSMPEPPPQAPEEEKKKRGRTLVSKGADTNVWDEGADADDKILFAEDGSVKAASLNKLIEKVTAPDSPDSVRMMKTFIATYESFTTPYELIIKLKERFVVPPGQTAQELPVQLRVCNVLRTWVEMNFKDFSEDDIEDLLDFVCNTITAVPRMKMYGDGLQRYIEKNRSSAVDAVRKQLVELKLEPKIPLSPARFLNVFDEAEVARQMTLVEHSMYKAIKPVELINQAWSKEGLKHRAPNVRAMIKRSTALSFWVASCILWQPTLKERSRVMTKIVNIGEHLRKLNNFNSIMALISGINLSAIHRLTHTRSELSGATLKTFQELEELMSSDCSFSKYRGSVNAAEPPCVPFLGVYLTDLTFSDDGSADKIGGLVNFGKRSRIYHMIEEILKFQSIQYDFEYVDHIASFLTELPQNSDRDLYNLSRELEPKGSDKSSIL